MTNSETSAPEARRPFSSLPAWHARPQAHAQLSDADVRLLLEAHGEDCERDGCELRRYLLRLQTLEESPEIVSGGS
ncbi:MAG: hypothetical protein JWN03_6161 [Nocardia sp.]|uniref:hypothetical protein n=1 Tax=Nocardia sp. TaxID=1821 RepID=UPI00261CB0B9|nr:hypothetical protein [Nocardia sp.]MCU1645886.1 hypothetical protein [Nocardia sp.]